MSAFSSVNGSGSMRVSGLVGLLLLASGTAAIGGTPSIPQTMHAIHSDPAGAPGAVKLETVPVPKPADGQVLLRVYAAGTNPVDWAVRTAAPTATPPKSVPMGRDVAGVIVAVGPGVSDFKVGDKVYTALATGGALCRIRGGSCRRTCHKAG